MRHPLTWILLALIIWSAYACDPGQVDIPEHTFVGLHKPVIQSLSPQAVKVNNTGFHLKIGSPESLEDSVYAVYINDKLAGSCLPDY